jgi:hypothetical protein
MADTIAHKITATEPSTGELLIQYVVPQLVRQARNILQEEGYDIVNDEELTELPDGVSIDVDVAPANAADYIE